MNGLSIQLASTTATPSQLEEESRADATFKSCFSDVQRHRNCNSWSEMISVAQKSIDHSWPNLDVEMIAF